MTSTQVTFCFSHFEHWLLLRSSWDKFLGLYLSLSPLQVAFLSLVNSGFSSQVEVDHSQNLQNSTGGQTCSLKVLFQQVPDVIYTSPGYRSHFPGGL